MTEGKCFSLARPDHWRSFLLSCSALAMHLHITHSRVPQWLLCLSDNLRNCSGARFLICYPWTFLVLSFLNIRDNGHQIVSPKARQGEERRSGTIRLLELCSGVLSLCQIQWKFTFYPIIPLYGGTVQRETNSGGIHSYYESVIQSLTTFSC